MKPSREMFDRHSWYQYLVYEHLRYIYSPQDTPMFSSACSSSHHPTRRAFRWGRLKPWIQHDLQEVVEVGGLRWFFVHDAHRPMQILIWHKNHDNDKWYPFIIHCSFTKCNMFKTIYSWYPIIDMLMFGKSPTNRSFVLKIATHIVRFPIENGHFP